jgi:integrase/rubredoxin
MAEQEQIHCPQCGSVKNWKDGLRYTIGGDAVQRYVCRKCGYRFSETSLNSKPSGKVEKQNHVAVYWREGPLTLQSGSEKWAAGATEKAETKGKIVEFLWHLKKEGYSQKTIDVYGKRLLQLARSCDILNSEEVKEFIAKKETWNGTTKLLTVEVYKAFASFANIPFKAPRYQQQEKIPFIPLEQEIDALIAGCSRKIATILQLLKETGIRIGEAK